MASWVPALRLPYVEWRWYGYTFSLVTGPPVSLVRLRSLAIPGSTFERNFDIDFTGGNAAQVVLKEPKSLDQIERAIKTPIRRTPRVSASSIPKSCGNSRTSPNSAARTTPAANGCFADAMKKAACSNVNAHNLSTNARSCSAKPKRWGRTRGRKIPPHWRSFRSSSRSTRNQRVHREDLQPHGAFKKQIAAAFVGSIGQEGDEITGASWPITTGDDPVGAVAGC